MTRVIMALRRTGPGENDHPASARAAAEEEITAALTRWRSRHPGVPVEVRVGARCASGRLLETAEAAKLRVVGTDGRGPGCPARTRLRRHGRTAQPLSGPGCTPEAHVLDLEAQDTERPVVDTTTLTAPALGPGGRTTAVNCGGRIPVE